MAKTLDDLMNIPGVVAAGEFKRTGDLIAYKGKISKDEQEWQLSSVLP